MIGKEARATNGCMHPKKWLAQLLPARWPERPDMYMKYSPHMSCAGRVRECVS